jgi:hypothetical protein
MVKFSAPWPLPHEQVLLQELNHRINTVLSGLLERPWSESQ